MSNTTSLSLLKRVRRTDDQAAWSRFVEIYTPLIFDWGCHAGLTAADAADLSQDVLLRLLSELPKFDYSPERGRFRSWLRIVTVNMCRERQRQNRIVAPGGSDLLSQFEDSNLGQTFWEKDFQQKVVSRALELMQTDFEPHVWNAAWRQIVEDEGPADIAKELGISIASVYQARSRVLRHLREQLKYLIDEE